MHMTTKGLENQSRSVSQIGFWKIASKRQVIKRATRIALVVGTILAIINHGDHILRSDINLNVALKILLTFCVPYSVSTYSSVLAIRENSITEGTERQD